MHKKIWQRNLKETDHLEDLELDTECCNGYYRNRMDGCAISLSDSNYGNIFGFCIGGNEWLCSINVQEIS
jgi:hypothetical protein